MYKLETLNELTLKATCDGNGTLFTKAGAFISGESYGGKNYQFEKVLLGPEGNPLRAALGQVARRFTGENLPLMKVMSRGQNVTYYANDEQHVTVINLNPGEVLSVESENILAFTENIAYSVRFLAQGVISQKGLATSTLRATGPGAQVAVLTEGNPIMISNMQNGAVLTADPDAIVCWVGADPSFKLDLSWKNLIGQASGESYMFEFNRPATIVMQPRERKSGIDIGMDGRGGQPTRQENNLFRQDGNQMLSGLGQAMGGNTGSNGFGGTNNNRGSGLGGILGGILGT